VLSWGNSIDGQLGHGDHAVRNKPAIIQALSEVVVSHIACTDTSTIVSYNKDGKESVCGFGANTFGILSFDEEDPPFSLPTKINLPSVFSGIPIKQIAGGKSFIMILLENGQLCSWGNGVHGQLGTGGAPDMKLPELVKSLKNEKVVKVACGSAHAMCITEDGKLFTWGNSHFSQLGHGDFFNENTPRQVTLEILKGRKIIDIGGGLYHTVVLTDRNEVFSWGRNDDGQCGQTSSTSKVVDPNIINTSHIRREKIISIECGLTHTLLLTDNGKVISFGSNKSGQLGNEPRENTSRSLPKVVEGLLSVPISRLVCGAFHSLAVDGSGTTLYGWGENSDYQLGIGDTRTSSYVPVAITGFDIGEFAKFSKLAAGMGHSLVVVNKQN